MEDKMVVLGGEVGYKTGFPEDFNVEDITSPSVFKKTANELEATLAFFIVERDVIRQVRVTGLEAEVREWEPSIEDRMAIHYHQFSRLLAGMGLDMHGFKKMLEMALWAMEYWNVPADDEMFKAVDKLHHEMGGLE